MTYLFFFLKKFEYKLHIICFDNKKSKHNYSKIMSL